MQEASKYPSPKIPIIGAMVATTPGPEVGMEHLKLVKMTQNGAKLEVAQHTHIHIGTCKFMVTSLNYFHGFLAVS